MTQPHADQTSYEMRRRGTVLLVVFVLILSATLLATTIIRAASAETSVIAATTHRAQLRALTWSGIQAVMAELDTQRDAILQGQTPTLTDDWSLYGTSTERGELTLLSFGPNDAIIESESGKIDLNSIDTEGLTRTGIFENGMAKTVINARDARHGKQFDSIGDLLSIDGLATDRVWNLSPSGSASSIGEAASRHLADDCTVYGFEPKLQETGRYKINLNAPWSDRMAERITRRYGNSIAQVVQTAKQNDEDFHISDTALRQLLAQSNEPPETWEKYLDGFCSDDDNFYVGRIDINRASVASLQSIEGLTKDQVQQIVAQRDGISDIQRAGTTWLIDTGILTREEWATTSVSMTTRTFAWRVRVRGRIMGGGIDDDPKVLGEQIYEVVVDLSSPEPRIAYLRDVTWLRLANQLIANGVDNHLEEPFDRDESSRVDDEDSLDSKSEGGSFEDSDDHMNPSKKSNQEPNDARDVDDPMETESRNGSRRTTGQTPEQRVRTPVGRWNRGGG